MKRIETVKTGRFAHKANKLSKPRVVTVMVKTKRRI